MEIVKILISLLPVFIFLLCLILLDSYKLVKPLSVSALIVSGCIAAIVSYFMNSWLVDIIESYRLFGPPIVEEIYKALFILYLLKKNKIGFTVDGAIYGFAVGAGFAFIENVYYLQVIESSNILVWIVRGFGTALMHGSTTAIFAIITKTLLDRGKSFKLVKIFPGLFLAIILHLIFNLLLAWPIVITLFQIVLLPYLTLFVYNQSEKSLRNWLELSLDTNLKIIEQINSNEFALTKIGRYLYSLKKTFPATVVVDIFCYLKIYMELSLRAKGLLMMRESGFNITNSNEVKNKLIELKFLEKSIGPTGKLTLSPILRTNLKDLWQIYFLTDK